MAQRFQKLQSMTVQQEKMASLGTLAAGLMHELNNPGAAARRAAQQLRENLMRMHELSQVQRTRSDHKNRSTAWSIFRNRLSQSSSRVDELSRTERRRRGPGRVDGVGQHRKRMEDGADAGLDRHRRQRAGVRPNEFDGPMLSEALSWLEAMVSSMQLVGTIEESIGRVTDLVRAVKSYAYEGKGQKQSIDINDSIHATMIILAHKLREKEIVVEKNFAPDLPPLHSECSGLNQIWTNLLDNAIDAVPQHGHIRIRTWAEKKAGTSDGPAHRSLHQRERQRQSAFRSRASRRSSIPSTPPSPWASAQA